MSNKIYLLFYIIIFSLISSNVIYAQEADKILVGKIVDESGIPVSGVNILDFETNMAAVSNDDGRFKLSLKNKQYSYLVISHISYESKKIRVKNEDNNLYIQLTFKYSDIPEITINGKSYNTIKERLDFLNQKNQNPSINNNIESLLVTMGGVNSNNELSNQYNVRGGNYDENIIYIHGIEVKKPLLIRNAQQEGLSFINPLMINRIDFSRGGFTSEYGDKMSSVLDIGYKKPVSNFEGSAYGSFTGGGIYLGSSSKIFSSVSSFRYKTTSKILSTSDIKGEYKPKFSNFQTFMNFNLSERLEFFLMGNYDDNKFEMYPQDRETKFGTLNNPKTYSVKYDGKEFDNYATYQGAAGFNYKVLDNLNISFSSMFFGSKESEKLDLLSNYELSNFNSENNLDTKGTYREYFRNRLTSHVSNFKHSGSLFLDQHEIKWGAQIDHENITDHIQEWSNIGASSSNKNETTTSLDYLNLTKAIYSNNRVKSNRYSGFLQDTYRFETNHGDNWTINLGLRMSHWEFNNENIISPRGTIAYIPSNDNFVFRFSSGVYYQSPFYKEIQQLILLDNGVYTYQLNNKIKSQKSIHFIFGNDYFFKSGDNRLKLTTELYYKKLSNINPYTIDNQRIYYLGENIGKGYIAGFDVRLFGEFIKGVDSWVSLSLMKTNQKLNGISLPISSDQRYNVSFFLQDYMPGYDRLSVSIKGVFADGLPFYNAPLKFDSDYLRFPAYKRIDLGFAWQLIDEKYPIKNRNNFLSSLRSVSLGIDFFNILDIKNTNNYYWLTDNSGIQYAVPNYLTGRMINFKFEVSF